MLKSTKASCRGTYLIHLLVVILLCSFYNPIQIVKGDNPDLSKVDKFINNRKTIEISSSSSETWEARLSNAMTQFTKDEQRCIRVRKYLSMLPSKVASSSVFSYFQNMVRKEIVQNYRKAAYEILMETENYEDSNHLRYIKGIIPQLYQIKETFYEDFYYDPFHKEKNNPRVVELKIELKEAEETLTQERERYVVLKKEMDEREQILIDIVKRLKDPTNYVAKAIDKLKRWDSLKDMISNQDDLKEIIRTQDFESFEEIDETIAEDLRKIKDGFGYISQMNDLSIIMESVREALLHSGSPFFKRQIKMIEDVQEKVSPVLVEKNTFLEETKTRICSKIEDKMEELFTTISENENLNMYQEHLQEKLKNEILSEEYLQSLGHRQKQVAELRLKLGSLEDEERKNFIITRAKIAEYNIKAMQENKYKQLLLSLERQECPKDASEDQETLISTSNFVRDLRDFWKKKNSQIEDTQRRMNQINALETQVDKAIAYLFASIFRLNSGLKCFLDSELSFFFFNMFKTNFIVDDVQFMKTFLELIEPVQARSFIVLNYVIFTNKEFVDQVISKNKQSVVSALSERPLAKMVTNFSMQFSVMISLFKNYSRDHADAQEENVENGTFLTTFYFVLTQVFSNMKDFMKETSITFLMSLIADIILSSIPFIGSISIIKIVVVKALVKLFNLISLMLYSLAGFNKAKVDSFIKGVRKMTKGKSVRDYNIDLDWKAVVKKQKKEELTVNPKISFKNIEDLYLQYYNENSVMIKAESVNLFYPDNYVLADNQEVLLDQEQPKDFEDASEVDEDCLLA